MLPELERWRADTPGCDHVIHLNNAGASLMPRPVLEAMIDHLQREAIGGGYESADHAAAAILDAYEQVARLLGAQARNIAIVENATVAFFQALSAFDFLAGDIIVTTRNDYISNQIAYLSLAKRHGVVIERAADLHSGGVDVSSGFGRDAREIILHRAPLLPERTAPGGLEERRCRTGSGGGCAPASHS